MRGATEDGSRLAVRGSLIAGGCVLLALVGLVIPSSPPPPPPVASAPPPEKAPVDKPAPSSPWPGGVEPRVTFAATMPRAQGSQVFNNTGTPNLAMIKVAIPDGPKAVRFVRGTDPEAVRYLEATRAEQERIVVDNGPADVDTSEVANYGPLKGRTTRRVRNLAPDGK